MTPHSFHHRILLCCCIISITLGPDAAAQSPAYMYAHFINVGQANSTLLEFPCGTILIDAGSQDDAYTQKLIDYLNTFFAQRQDLHKTLDAVLITHNHIDHTRALRKVVETFTVKRYIDNGQREGSGTGNPNWVKSEAQTRGITVKEVLNNQVFANGNTAGLTDADIDPLHCTTCDPEIHLLSGQLEDNPGWSAEDFDNKNNHSIVVRVDFGSSSFLFTGDLEKPAIKVLLSEYTSHLNMLDADVYEVGHHGSSNATTMQFLQAITPELAVISCGPWDFGQGSNGGFTTWNYGHPRKVTVDSLSMVIQRNRSKSVSVQVATAAREFQLQTVSKRIYATPWDGNIKVRASLDGSFYVTTRKE